MFRRFDVKWISGITANESCRLRITWLKIKRRWVDCSPASEMTTTAGTRAIRRVTSRRSQGARRRWRYPSITIWPASVPVRVELWPAHRSAMANKIGAP